MSPTLYLLGGGDHDRVLIDALALQGRPPAAIVDPDPALWQREVLGIGVLGDDERLLVVEREGAMVINGVGSIRSTERRQAVFERFKGLGFRFMTVLHPASVVSPRATLAEGVQVMAGAVIQVDSEIGPNTLINTRASVDHGCRVGAHVHVAPGVTLSGGVSIGAGTHVGSGATIIQGIRIGQGCLIGAGAVVIRDVPDGAVALGVPARVQP